LGEQRDRHTLELIALHGEDHYSAQGHVQFVAPNQGRFTDILLGINIDGAGYVAGRSVYSHYSVPAMIQEQIRSIFSRYGLLTEGDPWYQRDHSILLQNDVPALAVTTDKFLELSTEITITPKDRPELVDYAQLAEISSALRDCILELTTTSA
jgi:aminopeptidase YwaD